MVLPAIVSLVCVTLLPRPLSVVMVPLPTTVDDMANVPSLIAWRMLLLVIVLAFNVSV